MCSAESFSIAMAYIQQAGRQGHGQEIRPQRQRMETCKEVHDFSKHKHVNEKKPHYCKG